MCGVLAWLHAKLRRGAAAVAGCCKISLGVLSPPKPWPSAANAFRPSLALNPASRNAGPFEQLLGK